MSRPNYRVDAYDRIQARLKAQPSMMTCGACGFEWNPAHFASCPSCAISHDHEKWDDVSPEAEATRAKLRANRGA
jgi:hypothetical protein